MLVFVFAALVLFSGDCNGVPLEAPASDEFNSRIHGGVDAPAAYAPHMVALLAENPRFFVFCGGSIISKSHILTAAHCVTPFVENGKLAPTFHGRVGSNIWTSGGVLVYFKHYFIHPKWDEDIIQYDVAILCLTKPLKLSKNVAVIAINFRWVGGEERSYVTGWGTTLPYIGEHVVILAPTPEQLQLLYVNTLTHEQCAEALHSSPDWASIAPPLNPKVEICTFHSFGHGMCHGDSGSALVSAESGELIGVVSWGVPCARGAPDFYTRPSAVEDFILDNTEGLVLSETSL